MKESTSSIIQRQINVIRETLKHIDQPNARSVVMFQIGILEALIGINTPGKVEIDETMHQILNSPNAPMHDPDNNSMFKVTILSYLRRTERRVIEEVL